MTDKQMQTPEQIAAELSETQRKAIIGAKNFSFLGWSLTDRYEDDPEISEFLSEDIADPISGALTPLGLAVRDIITKEGR